MASLKLAEQLDGDVMRRLHAAAGIENRTPVQIADVALRTLLDQSYGARRALYCIDAMASVSERELAAKLVGRAILKAYDAILTARNDAPYQGASNEPLDSETSIEAEAVLACRG